MQWSKKRRRLGSDQEGAVFIEFVIVILPFLVLLFGLAQLTLMYFGSLAVHRAATTGARAAMVALDEDPQYLGGSRNSLGGQRTEMIEIAASFPIYALKSSPNNADTLQHALRSYKSSPYSTQNSVADGLTVSFPNGVSADRGSPITVKVTYEFPCEVPVVRGLMCDGGTITLQADSTLPNMSADYEYGQW